MATNLVSAIVLETKLSSNLVIETLLRAIRTDRLLNKATNEDISARTAGVNSFSVGIAT